MGLKKLFSTNHKAKEDHESKRRLSRTSTLSLAQSIKSSFTHSKDKHRSITSNSTTTNRYSQPSPPPSISQQPNNSGNVTQNERHHYNSNNPFITTTAPVVEISPVTPSESMRDVNDVVNVLRNSASSEMSSSSFSMEQEHAATIPIATIKEEPNIILNNPLNTEPMEIYPPNKHESNKYQVFEQVEEEEEEEEGKHTMLTPDATNEEEDALYAELLQVSSQIEKIDPKNALEIKDKLSTITQSLTIAADKSHQMHTKLLSVLDISKQTILASTEKNKELMETQDCLNLELQQLQDGHALTLNENKALYESLCKGNEELKEKYQHTQHELNEHIQAKTDIFNLIKQDEKEEMNNTQLLDKLKNLVSLLATHKVLEEKLKSKESALQEIESKYEQLIMKLENDEISERRKEAELQTANEIKELKEQLQQENDTRLSLEEKLKLEESSTSQMRELLEAQEIEHSAKNSDLLSQINILKVDTTDQLQKQVQEIIDLKHDIESAKAKNAELITKIKEFEASEVSLKEELQTVHEKSENDIQQLQEKMNAFKIENTELKEEVTDMENVSKEAARTVMDENEKLEKRIQQLEEDSNNKIHTLNEQLESLKKDKAEIVDENKQLQSKLDTLENLKQENSSLSELVQCLKGQIDELSKLKRQPSSRKREQDQQEELMHMHTKAQLSLIEYLEGEENIVSAMATLKKGLEERI